jgi:host factor-I protein
VTNRRLIRPNLAEIKERVVPPPSPPARKPMPPDATSAEAFYYLKQMNTKTPMVVILDSGEQLRGIIEWYDRGCIKLNRDDAPNLLLMKHAIRYMFKDGEDKTED